MDNRIVYAVLTLFLNCVGVPCFLQGKTKAGVLRIVLGVVSLGIIWFINGIMGIVMAVRIFQMSDQDFEAKKATLLMGIPSGL